MPLPKSKAVGATDVMKLDDGNDTLDTFIRQAIGKEPFLSFPRANDSPVQLFQLLHALDQQDVPGWPLLSPLKIQMQKCEKCSREFCSTISYRRHMRLHRRKLKLDKDSTMKSRGLLQAFWDKLSPEETMEIVSLNDVSLEGVSGSLIIKALTSFIRKPGFTPLPKSYVKSGSALLDIVQGRPSSFPISSQELFAILDGASEETFLCAGTAESLQKYVFDGEAGKIGLEMRNLVACTSFLVEQKLVKAWLADKDAEALRYQKLLVEEEEAAQKRQEAILERKRQKKLRQKEQRAKVLASVEIDDSPEDSSGSSQSLSPANSSDSILEVPHDFAQSPEPVQILTIEGESDKCHENGYTDLSTSQIIYPDLVTYQKVEHRTSHRSGRRHTVNPRWQPSKLQRTFNEFHTSHNYQAPKHEIVQKHVSCRDSRTSAMNGKVWTPKTKSSADEEACKTGLQINAPSPSGQDEKHEFLIGSMPVNLGICNLRRDENHGVAPETSDLELCTSDVIKNRETPAKTEAFQATTSHSTDKLCKPESRHDNRGQLPIQNGDTCEVSGNSGISCNDDNEVRQTYEAESCSNCHEENHASVEDGLPKGSRFNSYAAKAFLIKRWKEVLASDHVELILFPVARPPENPKLHNDKQEAVHSSKLEQRGILRSAENRLSNHTNLEQHSTAIKPKTRAQMEKGGKLKYVPKQGSAYTTRIDS
ncbi:unnamed protein product [Amaranthus hypochondriacus]